MLNNFCFHLYAQNSLSHSLSISHSHTLSISHSITLDMCHQLFYPPHQNIPPFFLSPPFYPPMILSPSVEDFFYPPSPNIPLKISPLSKYPLIHIFYFIPPEYTSQFFYPLHFIPPMILSPSIEELFYPPSQNIPLIISPLSKYPLILIFSLIPSEYPFQYFYPPYYIPPSDYIPFYRIFVSSP